MASTSNILTRTNTSREVYKLEEIIDIDKQIENFKDKQLKLVNPRQLYKLGVIDTRSQGFKTIIEEIVSCIQEDQVVDLDLITKQSYLEIQKEKYRFTHLGLIVIGIKSLTRAPTESLKPFLELKNSLLLFFA